MSSILPPEHEAFIQQEVERAVARYRKIVPPSLIPMLRNVAEQYWRTHPQAIVIGRTVTRAAPDASNSTRDGAARHLSPIPPRKR